VCSLVCGWGMCVHLLVGHSVGYVHSFVSVNVRSFVSVNGCSFVSMNGRSFVS